MALGPAFSLESATIPLSRMWVWGGGGESGGRSHAGPARLFLWEMPVGSGAVGSLECRCPGDPGGVARARY